MALEMKEEHEPTIVIQGLSKTFYRPDGAPVRAVDGVDLKVDAGELLVLLGPSGCGKTTLLRLLAGLEDADQGRIEIGGSLVLDADRGVNVPTAQRPLNMVFQSYALWPHMTAFENVMYPLRNRGMQSAAAREAVMDCLKMVGVEAVAQQHPSGMSGGQQQRVALARAIVGGDRAILFDEPLSNVDAKVREKLRHELLRMQHELGFTAVYVTHDQEEAMILGTRVAVLREGDIEQLAAPETIYDYPASRYVANFIGSINEVPGSVIESDRHRTNVETPLGILASSTVEERTPGSRVVAMVRPESWDLRSERSETDGVNQVQGVVETVLFLGGSRTEYVVQVGDHRVTVWDHQSKSLALGTPITLSVAANHVFVFPSI